MKCHRSEVDLHERDADNEHECQQRVEVVRDGADKHFQTGVFGSVCILGNGGSPTGDGGDHTDRGCGGVDDIRQLCPGDLLGIGHGLHHAADRETVEVVVNEDQHAQQESGKDRSDPGLDVGLRPSAERRRGAGLVDQCHHDPQHDQENEDPGRTLNRGNKAFVDHAVHCF